MNRFSYKLREGVAQKYEHMFPHEENGYHDTRWIMSMKDVKGKLAIFFSNKEHSFVHDTVTIDNTLENISQEKDICHNKNDCKSLYAHHTMKIYKRALTRVKMQSKRKKQQIRACTNIKSNITVQPAIQAKNN